MRGDLDELRRERGGTHTNYSDYQQESLGAAFKRVSDAKAHLAVKYEQLHTRVKELERPYPCSICAGTGKLLTGKPCGCTDGTIHGELHFIRMEAFKAQEQRAAALKLADKWMAQQFDYPDDMLGHYAAAAVRCCVRELRAIYADKEQVSATTARPWDASLTYQEGDRVTYKGEVRE